MKTIMLKRKKFVPWLSQTLNILEIILFLNMDQPKIIKWVTLRMDIVITTSVVIIRIKEVMIKEADQEKGPQVIEISIKKNHFIVKIAERESTIITPVIEKNHLTETIIAIEIGLARETDPMIITIIREVIDQDPEIGMAIIIAKMTETIMKINRKINQIIPNLIHQETTRDPLREEVFQTLRQTLLLIV